MALALFGFFIGLAGSVLGVGGGIFVVPALVLFVGVPIRQAIAVSLAAIIATSSAVASVNVERRLANMRLGIVLELTTALGSIGGALAAGALSARAMQLVFAFVLFPVGASMLVKSLRPGKNAPAPDASPVPALAVDSSFYDPEVGAHILYRVKNLGPASFISFLAGGLSGLLGLGGGIIQVPMMTLLCGVPMKAAAATSNFLIGVSAAASALIYLKRGELLPDLAAVIVIGVLLGSFLGIKVLYKAPAKKLQAVFALFVFAVAIKMLQKAL